MMKTVILRLPKDNNLNACPCPVPRHFQDKIFCLSYGSYENVLEYKNKCALKDTVGLLHIQSTSTKYKLSDAGKAVGDIKSGRF